jgi:hypothetical protein
MAFVTPAFLLASSAVATAGSAAFGFVQQQQAASYQQKVANQNAEFQRKLTESNLSRARLESMATESALREQNDRRMATLRAAIGAAGTGFGGSPLEIVADSARAARLDLEYLRINNRNREYDIQLQGQTAERNYRFDAQAASFQRQAAYGTLLGGFSQAVGMGAQAYQGYKQEALLA